MVQDLRSSWRRARVVENRAVANGSMWLSLEASDALPAAFAPGHVLGLGLKQADDTLMRHAYTVSRGQSTSGRFEHLYRIVHGGRMSTRLAQLSQEDIVYFHGPFHTPIQEEIHSDAERIVLISTGAGIGPLFGYAEKTLSEGELRRITLYAGFREESDTCLVGELRNLENRHANFSWHYTLSRPSPTWYGLKGRVTESVPECLTRQELTSSHFHLVGNGEMVHLVRRALHHAGVATNRVSIETYFNHYANPSTDRVEELASRFRNGATTRVTKPI